MELFDAHCHVDEAGFDPDRNAVHARMRENGVTRLMIAGSDVASSIHCVRFAQQREGCWAAVGVHPHEAAAMSTGDLDAIAALLEEDRVQALGEIGLDYHYDFSPRDVQKRVMEAQLDLAWQTQMPVVFHIREAHQDVLDALRARKGRLTGGVIHCFSGSWEIAKEYLKLGYYISFAGPVTFKKAPKLQEAAINMPLDRLLIETDSPYLAPEPVRGKRNEPANVRFVCEKIAVLRGVEPSAIAQATTQNALRVYRIA